MNGFERSQDIVERFLQGKHTQSAAVDALIDLMRAHKASGGPPDALKVGKPQKFMMSTADHARFESLMAAVDRRMSSGVYAAPVSTDVILRRFEHPDEVRALTLGRFEIVRIGGMTIGRATYQPGWRWSEHVGRALGQERCEVEHLGLVLAGVATAAFADGRVVELRGGELFYIPPEPHDSWVVGDEPYVSLHFMGAEKYAR